MSEELGDQAIVHERVGSVFRQLEPADGDLANFVQGTIDDHGDAGQSAIKIVGLGDALERRLKSRCRSPCCGGSGSHRASMKSGAKKARSTTHPMDEASGSVSTSRESARRRRRARYDFRGLSGQARDAAQ